MTSVAETARDFHAAKPKSNKLKTQEHTHKTGGWWMGLKRNKVKATLTTAWNTSPWVAREIGLSSQEESLINYLTNAVFLILEMSVQTVEREPCKVSSRLQLMFVPISRQALKDAWFIISNQVRRGTTNVVGCHFQIGSNWANEEE